MIRTLAAAAFAAGVMVSSPAQAQNGALDLGAGAAYCQDILALPSDLEEYLTSWSLGYLTALSELEGALTGAGAEGTGLNRAIDRASQRYGLNFDETLHARTLQMCRRNPQITYREATSIAIDELIVGRW